MSISQAVIEQQKTAIQGYVPRLTFTKVKGKRRVQYVAFKGGFTLDFMEAFCVGSADEALAIARRNAPTIFALPAAIPVNGLCELIEA